MVQNDLAYYPIFYYYSLNSRIIKKEESPIDRTTINLDRKNETATRVFPAA